MFAAHDISNDGRLDQGTIESALDGLNQRFNSNSEVRKHFGVLEPRERGNLFIFVGYAIWNIAAVMSSNAQESYDTYRYFGLVFDVQNPGITTTALFMAVEDHQRIIYLLTAISVVSWSLLAGAVMWRLRYTWIRWPMALLILLFSMTTPIWSYNTVLLTESLTVSFLVVWLATIVWVSQAEANNYWWSLSGLLVSAGFAIITRPQLLIVIVPIQVVLLVWTARRSNAGIPSLVTGAALLPFVAFGIFRIYQLSLVQLYQFRYALNNVVDKGSSFRPYSLENMPPCEAIPAALNGPAPWNDIHALTGTLIQQCPETWIWFNSDAIRADKWILADPLAAFLDFFGSMTRIELAVMSEGRSMPDWLSNLILNISEPWLWMLLYAILGTAFAIGLKVRPKVTVLGVIGSLTVALTTIGYLIAMWASDGYDINRHIYPVLPIMAVAFLVFPAVIPTRQKSE